MQLRVILTPSEPFRLFFPLGLVIGLIGVLVWPLYQLEMLEVYPLLMHSRLMAEGFMAAFVFGFLGTAGPRMLTAPSLKSGGILLLLVMHAAAAVCHLLQLHRWGDLLFLTTLLLFVAMFGVRFARRQDLPPPPFVMVALGFLAGICGAVLLLFDSLFAYALGNRLLFEGFFLLPMLGIGTFLFPRFLGLPVPQAFPGSRTPPAWWWQSAGGALAFGVVILATYFLEVVGYPVAGIAIRFAAACAFLIPRAPFLRGKMPGTVAGGMKLGIVLLLAGLLLMALFPKWRVTMLHVLMIGGFALIVFLVATRVMFGHSGLGMQLRERTWFLRWMIGLMLAALALRIVADFYPSLRMHFISGAAVLWLVGAVIWAVRAAPRVFVPDADDP